MTAARTEAVELKPVGFDGESIACGDFFLKLFNFVSFQIRRSCSQPVQMR